LRSPPLVPEKTDQEAPFPAPKVTPAAAAAALVERITVSEHFMMVEYVSARPPERRAEPCDPGPVLAA
ncbi:MAG TPA: hypothetical protein VIL63_08730, partial [Terriglobales bacterium]